MEKTENVDYYKLRDCIFYGGEKYEDKIMGNQSFEQIIISKEENFKKYIDNAWWIKYPSKFIRSCGLVLKKLI